MNRSGWRTIWLVACLGLAALTSCTFREGPPLASTSIEAPAGLEVGTIETYRFEVEAEALGEFDEGFRVFLSEPSRVDLSERGIAFVQSWLRHGVEEADWPNRIIVKLARFS